VGRRANWDIFAIGLAFGLQIGCHEIEIDEVTFDENPFAEIMHSRSWQRVHSETENEEEEKDSNADDCDAFAMLTRGVLVHPRTFSVPTAQSQELPTNFDAASSNVRMDEDEVDEDDEDEKKTESAEDAQTYRELHGLLQCCFVRQICQLAMSSMSPTFITLRMIPFLRRSCILYHSLGCVDTLDALWSSSSRDTDDDDKDSAAQIECDALCATLSLPTVAEVLTMNNGAVIAQYKNENGNREFKRNWDLGRAFSLISLPSSYNELFQVAAESQCARKSAQPKYSAICLLCGQFVCIDCCSFGSHGDVVRHCAECNNGMGVFLWLQKSRLILVWNGLAAMLKSVYLDKYGEEDYGLVRGHRIALNEERYRQLARLVTQNGIPNKMVQLRKTNRDLLERVLGV